MRLLHAGHADDGDRSVEKYPLASDDDIRKGLSGNLCRCTGYEHIVRAIRAVAGKAGNVS